MCPGVSHLALAEHVFLLEGEQDDVSVVGRVLDGDVLSFVLEHSRRFVDDPVRTEERQQQAAARRPRRMDVNVHSHVYVRVAGETYDQELGHFLFNPNVSVPVASLIPHQHQRHDLA